MNLSSDSPETQQLLNGVSQGNKQALENLLGQHRDYLRRVIEARIERGLRARVDPSDVVQETLVAVSQRIDDYLERRPACFRLWLRSEALQQLGTLRRRHLAQKRSVARDIRISDASSRAIVEVVLSGGPSDRLMKKELLQQVKRAMQLLSEDDRDMLVLRHVEQLKNDEVAELLGLEPGTASKRYGRALHRLHLKFVEMGISQS